MLRTTRGPALLGGLVVALAHLGAAQTPGTKPSPPDAAAQARAEAVIKRLFKDEYDRAAKDPAAAKTLAADLLKQAQATGDSPELRFVALREARDLAAAAGDTATAFLAIAEMVRHHRVDALTLKADALARAADSAKTEDLHRAIAEAALRLIDEALADDDYAAAFRLGALAEAGAVKARNLALVATAQKRTGELQALEKEFKGLKPAADKLRTSPKDPDANLAMGRYLCLVRGNWERGLPHLALGSDAGLKKLAALDLAAPTKPAERLALADAWWAAADRGTGDAQKPLRQRAVHWYHQAAPGLSGAEQARAEKRIAEAGGALPAVVGLIRTFAAGDRVLQSAALSPDGKTAAAGGDDDLVRLWDVAAGKQVRALKGHTNQVWSVAFSPDGKSLVSASEDRTVRLWDVATGKELRQFVGHKESVNRATFSDDGRAVLTASDDRTLRLWDAATGKELRRFEGHLKPVWGAALSKDGKRVVSGAMDKTLGVWEGETGREVRAIEGHTDSVMSVAVTADGARALSGSYDRTVRLWDVKSGKELKRYTGHTGPVLSVALSPDGRRALSAGQDRVIRLWDVETGAELRRLEGHTDEVSSVAFSADGRFAVSAGMDKTVRLWGLPK